MIPVTIEPAAARDIEDLWFYLALRSERAGERFREAVSLTIEWLAENPGAGRIREFENERLTGLRSWPVRGFRKYLIFYRTIEEALNIVRVLHGAQDIERVLGE